MESGTTQSLTLLTMIDEQRQRIRDAAHLYTLVALVRPELIVVACPFCGHPPESMLLQETPRDQVFYCMVCKESGDIVKLAQHIWKVGESEAIDRLSVLTGITRKRKKHD